MPNLLDYERLVRQVADLNVELAMLKGKHSDRTLEDKRWDIIEEQPLRGTATEERRLRKVIREWEERYDILNELFVRQSAGQQDLDWHKVISDRKYNSQQKKQTFYTRIKASWALIWGPK